MSVYLKNFPSRCSQAELVACADQVDLPAFERVASLVSGVANPPTRDTSLELMGVHQQDKAAQAEMGALAQELQSPECTVEQAKRDSGVFYIKGSGECRAVFKIGMKRGQTEIAMRQLAHLLGLGKYTTSGMLCVVQDPPIDYSEDLMATVEERFSGGIKEYLEPEHNQEARRQKAVGIVEPFLRPTKSEHNLLEFTRSLILSLAMGLRDGKEDGFIWVDGEEGRPPFPVNVDAEDVMPPAFQPPISDIQEQKALPIIHLPLLGSPYSFEKLSQNDKRFLRRTVQDWNIFAIVTTISQITSRFFDRIVEGIQIESPAGSSRAAGETESETDGDESASESGTSRSAAESSRGGGESELETEEDESDAESEVDIYHDEGGCPFTIVQDEIGSKELNVGRLTTPGGRLFSDQQLEALNQRLNVLKLLIQSDQYTRPFDLVRSVDPYYAIWLEETLKVLSNEKNQRNTPLSPEERRVLTREIHDTQSAYANVGSRPPSSLHVILPEGAVQSIVSQVGRAVAKTPMTPLLSACRGFASSPSIGVASPPTGGAGPASPVRFRESPPRFSLLPSPPSQ